MAGEQGNIFEWLEKARPKLITFRDMLQKRSSKQELLQRLAEILTVNAETPKTAELAKKINSVKNDMTSLIKELKEHSQRQKGAEIKQESAAAVVEVKPIPATKTSVTSAAPISKSKKVKETPADGVQAPQQPQKVVSPTIFVKAIRLQASELQRIMTYCAFVSTEEAHIKQLFAKILVEISSIKDNYAAYRVLPTTAVHNINLSKSIMSVLSTVVEDIGTYSNKSTASIPILETTMKVAKSGDEDDNSSDDETSNDSLFTRKVDIYSILGDVTTLLAMVFAHLDDENLYAAEESMKSPANDGGNDTKRSRR
jgi:ribosomal protein L17